MTIDPYQSPKSKSQYSDGGNTSGLLLFEDAVRELVENWRVVLVASFIPLLCSSLIQYAGFTYLQSNILGADPDAAGMFAFVSLGFAAASFPFYVLFATNCHRIILLGKQSIPNRLGLYWSHDQTRFLGWVIVLAIIAFFAAMPAGILGAVVAGFDLATVPIWVFPYLGTALSTYFEGRFGLVFPATAVGKRSSLGESWRRTRSIQWAVFFALLIPIAITQAATFVLAKFFVSADLAIGFLLQQVLLYPLIAVGVAILTIVYRDFGRDAS